MERDPAWYAWKTALALVQATGRSVRSEDDWAITVILDSAFEQFLIRNQDILPEWWKAAIEFK
jgi:Rad3-related DNA helicase